MIADKAYASRGFRAYLRKRGIGHTIPGSGTKSATAAGQAATMAVRHGGRPPRFDRDRLKGFRAIATRYDKTATSFEAAVSPASFLLCARSV
ncbi:hypothetical protein GCM10009654_31170 [Streptomyces hebeiensis]|uniref:Transposase n=1 Tax=Streptomyces hebeiensis TaxID=229486 RepID=A0ABN1UUX8_9ACTN